MRSLAAGMIALLVGAAAAWLSACSSSGGGSCTLDQAGSQVCVSYSGSTDVRQACSQGGGTYSSGGCPDGAVGSCSVSLGSLAEIISYYPPLTAAVAAQSCATQGGTWRGGTGDAGAGTCSYPKVQNVSQPCCVAYGPDACGANLFCAALDGRTVATCYPLHSRLSGESCTGTEQCLDGTCIGGICCRQAGQACLDSTQCCAGTCSQQQCVCRKQGETCSKTTDCCTGTCTGGKCYCAPAAATCSAPGECCGGSCAGGKCCSALGASCTGTADCCGGDFCAMRCCRLGGGDCATVSDCCYNTCAKGKCCDVVGLSCEASYAHCCDGSVCATPDGFSSRYCCVPSGGPCTPGGASGGCCHGYCSDGGKCP